MPRYIMIIVIEKKAISFTNYLVKSGLKYEDIFWQHVVKHEKPVSTLSHHCYKYNRLPCPVKTLTYSIYHDYRDISPMIL